MRLQLGLVLAALMLTLWGSTTSAQVTETASTFEKDRQAILAMAGCFHVRFQFDETVAIAPGYELHKPHRSNAVEWVEVVEDSPRRIVLQHLLVLGERVVKHWRQEWVYENATLLEYQGHNRWTPRELSKAEVAGTWTQKVYQVDDSPRYESIGRWRHEHGLVCWESQWTNRPLPRREYTERDDYDVLVARNRHTLMPTGWVHEQDNYKLVLDVSGTTSQVLARETGLNVYARCDAEEGALARQWWEEHGRYWEDVRTVWSRYYTSGEPVVLAEEVEGQPLHRALGRLGQELSDAEAYDSAVAQARIAGVIESFRVKG